MALMGKTNGFVVLASTFVLAFAIGCGSSEPGADGTTGTTSGGTASGTSGGDTTAMVTADQVAAVLTTRCMPCHGGAKPQEELNMQTIDGLLKGSEHGAVVVPGDAAGSMIVHALHGTNGKKKMPPAKAPAATDAEIKLIEDWINAGAKTS